MVWLAGAGCRCGLYFREFFSVALGLHPGLQLRRSRSTRRGVFGPLLEVANGAALSCLYLQPLRLTADAEARIQCAVATDVRGRDGPDSAAAAGLESATRHVLEHSRV